MLKPITFAFAIATISWLVGMIINGILMKTTVYYSLSNLNLIKRNDLNKKIGLGIFKWIVINTPFKFFNQKLKLKTKIGLEEMLVIRKEMTIAEISHFIGFGFVTIFMAIKLTTGNYWPALVILIVNVFINLYPSLLQQENKRRIDRLIRVASRKNDATRKHF
jgi:hypothetical protein